MSWTNISKPTGSSYTRVNPVGRENYDQSDITFDSTTVFYDGVNQAAYTNVLKPITGDTWAQAIYTWASATRPWQSPSWNLLNKPS